MNKITFQEAYNLIVAKEKVTAEAVAKYAIAGNDNRRNKYEYRCAGLRCLRTLLTMMSAKPEEQLSEYLDEVFIDDLMRVCGIQQNKSKVVITVDTDPLDLWKRGWDIAKIIKRCKEQGDIMFDRETMSFKEV